MLPVAQAAVSIFGASLAPASQPAGLAPLQGFAGPAPGIERANAAEPFADLITSAVGQVSQLEKSAKTSVEGLMSGTGVDVHQAMIATEKAEMGFELVLAVRNKALAAYQQIMGMQF